MDARKKSENVKVDPIIEAPLKDEKVVKSKEEIQSIVNRLSSKANNASQKNLSTYKINYTFTYHMVSPVNHKIDIENGKY